MRVIAIVPAYNEAPRLGAVLPALVAAVRAGTLADLVVVDDGSTDGTAEVARAAGVRVLVQRPNAGKGQAMRLGCCWAWARGAEAVGFFDADLVGLTAAHVAQLVAPLAAGRAGMVCGMRDYGATYNALQAALPPITGERVLLRRVAEAVPAHFWSGFKIEVALNVACERLRLPNLLTVLDGVGIHAKWDKVGMDAGAQQWARMLHEVLVALRDAAAEPPPGAAR